MGEDIEHLLFLAEYDTQVLSVDLHGLYLEQAVFEIEKNIQAAWTRGEKYLRLIHGRGTGRLRGGVHEALRTHKLVAAFRDSSRVFEIGGVTLVVLHSRDA